MASVFTETFEAGTNGVTLSSSNTAFTDFFGDPAEFTNAQTIEGTLAADFSASGAQCRAGLFPAATGLYFRRFYVYFTALPASNSYIGAVALTGQGSQADMRVETDGRIAIRDGFSAVWTSTVTLAAGEWHRIEWKLDSTGLVQACRLFIGANLHGTTPDDESGDVTFNTGTWDEIRIGNVTSNTLGVIVDAVADDDADYPAPLESGPGPGPGPVFTENFEGGTDGAAITTANTGFGEFFGSPTFTANQPLEGALSGDFTSDGTIQQRANVAPAPSPPLYFRRMYFRISALAAQFYLAALTASAAHRADIRVGGTGILAVRDGWSARWSASQTIAVGDWNRLEWGIDVTNVRQQVQLYLGANMHGDVPDDTSGWVPYTTGQWDTMGIGTLTAVAGVGLQIDAVADSDIDWVGPLEGTTPPFIATRWLITTGGVLVPLKRSLLV